MAGKLLQSLNIQIHFHLLYCGALDKLYFQKSTVLVHFSKKEYREFSGVLTICLKKHTPRNDKTISTRSLNKPGLMFVFLG